MKQLILIFFLSFFSITLNAADTWTSSFSEEGRNYQYCPSRTALKGIQCSGGYCDNISLYCGELGSRNRGQWKKRISEERRGGSDTVNGIVVRKNDYMQRCGVRGYITGMQCTGGSCDNISLYCSTFKNKKPRNCSWTSWISEEHGGRLIFGSKKYAVAMECKGSRCDNKRFYVCN